MVQWTEKYRPNSLDEIVGQDCISRLKGYLKKTVEDFNNSVFVGPPGTGKTTAAHAFVKEINAHLYSINAAEKNDKMSIMEIGKEIEDTGRFNFLDCEEVQGEYKCKTEGSIWILEKAEQITLNAQAGMEDHLDKTIWGKVIFVTNDYSKLSNAIQSRLTKFEFKELKDKDIEKIIFNIAEKENFTPPDNVVNKIVKEAKGIPRLAVRKLQDHYMQNS